MCWTWIRRDPSWLDAEPLEEATALYELTNDDRFTLIDITPVNRTRNFHNFSLETPEYFDDLYLRLSNEHTTKSRALYRVRDVNSRAYWVLTRGR